MGREVYQVIQVLQDPGPRLESECVFCRNDGILTIAHRSCVTGSRTGAASEVAVFDRFGDDPLAHAHPDDRLNRSGFEAGGLLSLRATG